jgi:type I restriction enzyme R subunit
MNKIVKAERVTQNRIIALFASDKLGYNKLGNWEDKDNNSNIEEVELKEFLKKTGKYSDEIIKKAILALQKEAKINRDDDLYTINKAFYSRLRYGIPIKTDVQHQAEIVQFIDWQNPINNNFAVAEEVTISNSLGVISPKCE